MPGVRFAQRAAVRCSAAPPAFSKRQMRYARQVKVMLTAENFHVIPHPTYTPHKVQGGGATGFAIKFTVVSPNDKCAEANTPERRYGRANTAAVV